MREFPVFFPVNREFASESGSHETPSTTNARTVHPFEVFGETVLRDIAVLPVPVDARPGNVRWVLETVQQGALRAYRQGHR